MDQLKPQPINSCPLTPLGLLDRAAIAYGDRTSIVYNDTRYTWSQTHRRCLQLASSLSLMGIGRGHVVSVVAPNIPAMCELHFAVPMCGAILSNINTRLDAPTISVLLRHSESKLVFVDPLSSTLVLQAISLFPSNTKPPMLVLINDDDISPPTPLPLSTSSSSSSSAVDFFATYESMVEQGDPNFQWVRLQSELDPIIFRMPHYMVPRTVVFKEELPKTSTGKIQKFVLREIAKDIHP